MNEMWFSLAAIEANPFQPRFSEDGEHVRRLADSILQNGLMQVPVGRVMDDDTVQLAFGHSRLAAFRLLASEGRAGFEKMPVSIQALDDQQMFEYAVTENVARKNLSPIEEAQAMKRYRDEFGKTSAQIGELFGVSDSAVRNKLRLLNLPEEAQAGVQAGQLNESSARRLLTLQQVLPEAVEALTKKAVAEEMGPREVEAEVSFKLNAADKVRTMWAKHMGDEVRAGYGLWPLDWMPTKSGLVCTSCEQYVRMSGNHYCCDVACWKRKRNEWAQVELRRLNYEMGVAPWNGEDGKDWVEVTWSNERQFADWLAEKDGGLRLRVAVKDGPEYLQHRLTKSLLVQLISVDAAAVAEQKAEFEAIRERQEAVSYNNDSWQERHRRQEMSEAFLMVAARSFAGLMGAPLDAAVETVIEMAAERCEDYKYTLPEGINERVDLCRYVQALDLLLNGGLVEWETMGQGPVAVAGRLREVARDWGVWIPEDWDETARMMAEKG